MFRLKLKLNSDNMIDISTIIFTILYFIPISITFPEILRKPLLVLGFVSLAIAVFAKNYKYFIIMILTLLFLMAYYYVSWSSEIDFFSYIFPAFVSVEFGIVSMMVLDGKFQLSKKVIWFLLAITFITAITSIIGLQQYPLAIRTLAKSATDDNASLQHLYRQHNIAGWGLLFAMAFLEGPLLFLYKKTKKWIFLFMLVLDGICVLLSQLAFAIILMFIVIFLVFINGQQKKIILRIIPFFILVLIMWFERERVLETLYNLAVKYNLDILQLRVSNLHSLLLLKDTSGDAGTRFELYINSFNSFISHPFGLFFVSRSSRAGMLGFHSEFFDMIGATGVFGCIAIGSFISAFVIRIKKIKEHYYKRFYASMWGNFIIMFIINPVITQPHVWIATFLVPAILVMDKPDQKYEVTL